ncbi:MAG TPA: SemiSWEET family transporter [Candidatus Omnitrophota bacterium]|nr:SemiSWEET family transporter [Candidatus Omnitrophota bacterium]HPT39696.1 SemiSWEET family transporter [Candidatus Omnitrophota bacterium]
MIWTIIGITAAVLTMFSFVPQVFRSLRTKSVKDVSPVTLFQLASGVILWTIYGIGRHDLIIIAANIFTLVTLLILIFLYFNYGRLVK